MAAVLVWDAGAARADDPQLSRPSPPPRIRQEWIGLEVALGGYATNVSPGTAPQPKADVPHFTGGGGGLLRLGRHHWDVIYWTPLELGLFQGFAGAEAGFATVLTEVGGTAYRDGANALDLGMGFGLGMLGVTVGRGCDATCSVGGEGVMISPVARYAHTWRSHASVGVSLRIIVPSGTHTESVYGWILDSSSLVMLGMDFAYGEK